MVKSMEAQGSVLDPYGPSKPSAPARHVFPLVLLCFEAKFSRFMTSFALRVFITDEAFFFDRSDEFAIYEKSGCGVVPDSTSKS